MLKKNETNIKKSKTISHYTFDEVPNDDIEYGSSQPKNNTLIRDIELNAPLVQKQKLDKRTNSYTSKSDLFPLDETDNLRDNFVPTSIIVVTDIPIIQPIIKFTKEMVENNLYGLEENEICIRCAKAIELAMSEICSSENDIRLFLEQTSFVTQSQNNGGLHVLMTIDWVDELIHIFLVIFHKMEMSIVLKAFAEEIQEEFHLLELPKMNDEFCSPFHFHDYLFLLSLLYFPIFIIFEAISPLYKLSWLFIFPSCLMFSMLLFFAANFPFKTRNKYFPRDVCTIASTKPTSLTLFILVTFICSTGCLLHAIFAHGDTKAIIFAMGVVLFFNLVPLTIMGHIHHLCHPVGVLIGVACYMGTLWTQRLWFLEIGLINETILVITALHDGFNVLAFLGHFYIGSRANNQSWKNIEHNGTLVFLKGHVQYCGLLMLFHGSVVFLLAAHIFKAVHQSL